MGKLSRYQLNKSYSDTQIGSGRFGEVKYRIANDSEGMQPAALSLHLLRYPGFRINVFFWGVGGGRGTHKLYFENHIKNTPYDFD